MRGNEKNLMKKFYEFLFEYTHTYPHLLNSEIIPSSIYYAISVFYASGTPNYAPF